MTMYKDNNKVLNLQCCKEQQHNQFPGRILHECYAKKNRQGSKASERQKIPEVFYQYILLNSYLDEYGSTKTKNIKTDC